MRRRAFLGTAAIMAGTLALPVRAQEAPTTFILIHGAWHGAWCWQLLTPLLEARGHQVIAPTLAGMGERASLLEDAVARLADNRLRGEVSLRLNEAEFLLLLGEERLRLFDDSNAAIQAYSLADAALAGLDDPVLATVRQTLAQELATLRAVPPDSRAARRA